MIPRRWQAPSQSLRTLPVRTPFTILLFFVVFNIGTALKVKDPFVSNDTKMDTVDKDIAEVRICCWTTQTDANIMAHEGQKFFQQKFK